MRQDNPKYKKIVLWLNCIEDNIVILLLSSILLFAITQVILRNFFDSGIVWGENLLRVLVLWLGLAGAIVATRQRKQIRVDVLSQFLPDKYKNKIRQMTLIFTIMICLIISYYSFEFTILEFNANSLAFEKVPSWITIIIIPVSFLIMAIKYLIQILDDSSGNNK